MAKPPLDLSAGQIELWMTACLSELLGRSAGEINRHSTFDELGLDSLSALTLLGVVETYLGDEVDPTLPYDFPTVAKMSAKLAALADRKALAGGL
jgi:acyl carrier protein